MAVDDLVLAIVRDVSLEFEIVDAARDTGMAEIGEKVKSLGQWIREIDITWTESGPDFFPTSHQDAAITTYDHLVFMIFFLSIDA
jgi:hypothetical protein